MTAATARTRPDPKPRHCLKCGHVNTQATGSELEACPQCGAIYSRVEAARAGNAPSAFRPAASAPAPTHRRMRRSMADKLDQLRERSNYASFRTLVRAVELVSYVCAALSAALAGLLIKNEAYVSGIGLFLAAFYGAVMARFAKEAAMMLADGCDALVTLVTREDD